MDPRNIFPDIVWCRIYQHSAYDEKKRLYKMFENIGALDILNMAIGQQVKRKELFCPICIIGNFFEEAQNFEELKKSEERIKVS